MYKEHPAVKTRFPSKLCALFLPLPLVACSRKESPAAALSPADLSVPAAAVAASPPSQSMHFTGEIVAHEEFQKAFAPKMMFGLEPYGGNDSGWSIRIAPISESGGPAIDCIGAVETPLHGDTKIEIEPPASAQSQGTEWKNREFEYAATAADCKVAWELMNEANYDSKLSENEREEASAKLAHVATHHGKFAILDARFGPANPQNTRGTLEWLKFEVDLGGASAPPPAEKTAVNSSIRSIDLKPFIESRLGELNPALAALATDCGDGQTPLQSLAPILYADLDGDGQEEAAVEGWSCLSGNGGADFRGVLKLMPDGKLVALPFESVPKTFKGRDPYAHLRGHMVIKITGGRFNEVYGIYNGSEPNCCAEGGERRFIYRWDGHQFALDDMIDVPPERNNKKSGN
jgi:hypothetical protein